MADLFGKCTPTHSALQTLQLYKVYLETTDGGERSSTAVEKQMHDIRAMWGLVSPQFNLEEFIDRNRFRDKCLNPLRSCSRPGTCTSYLSVLVTFLKFLSVQKLVTIEQTQALRDSMDGWRKTISKALKVRCHQKKIEDRGKLGQSQMGRWHFLFR